MVSPNPAATSELLGESATLRGFESQWSVCRHWPVRELNRRIVLSHDVDTTNEPLGEKITSLSDLK
jgi:hypothetical protein